MCKDGFFTHTSHGRRGVRNGNHQIVFTVAELQHFLCYLGLKLASRLTTAEKRNGSSRNTPVNAKPTTITGSCLSHKRLLGLSLWYRIYCCSLSDSSQAHCLLLATRLHFIRLLGVTFGYFSTQYTVLIAKALRRI